MNPQEQFLHEFRELIRRVIELPDLTPTKLTPFGNLIAEFLGADPSKLPATSDEFALHRLVDIDLALASLVEGDPNSQLLGIAATDVGAPSSDLYSLVKNRYQPFEPGPVQYRTMPTGPHSTRQVVTSGVHMFRFDGHSVVVFVSSGDEPFGEKVALVQAMSVEPDVAAACLDELRERMLKCSAIRGQVVAFSTDEHRNGVGGLTFIERLDVPADRIVLPEGVLDRIREHVVGIGEHASALTEKGQHLKRGVLLYGPPGTGKTLTVQHLIHETPGRTVILLQGGSLRYVGEAAKLARAMAPAMLVFEDVDLVALDRTHHEPQPLLFEMLDALDGANADADVAFVMTTNRADLLEPALAARPGRVDLAVEVPLPDAQARRQLFALYGGDTFSSEALDAAADAAEGVTASFAKELIRRAILAAVTSDRAPHDADLEAALAQMLAAREQLTATLLGMNASPPAPTPHVEYDASYTAEGLPEEDVR